MSLRCLWNKEFLVRYVKNNGMGKKSLNKQQGKGIATDIGGVAADAFIHYGVPWLAKKNC